MDVIGDALSAVALVVSLLTWYRSASVEKRIRTQSDNREAFDAWINRPIEASINALELLLSRLSAAALGNSAVADRSAAMRLIQSSEFDPWFFDFDAFCDHHRDEVMDQIRDHSSSLVDGILEVVNELAQEASEREVLDGARTIIRLKQSFASHSRAALQAARLGIK